MMKKPQLLIFTTIFFSLSLFSQEDDLLSLLGDEETTEIVTASFKTNRVIHGHSLESTSKGVLDFKISHRFGMLNTGFTELFGLDNAMIRFGFDYGISDDFTIGIGRSNFQKIFDGFLKYKLIKQTRGKRVVPVTIAYLSDVELSGVKNNPDPEQRSSSRFSFTNQVIIGRKFSENFSLQLAPTLVHRNLVDFNEENNVWSIGFGARQKLSKRVALTAEYYLVPGDQLPSDDIKHFRNSVALGFDIETGGHVFQLHFTNSTSMAYKGFIAETIGDIGDGGIHFGFNVSRVFTVSGK